MNNIGTQVIETERLVLRKFCISDVDNMFNNWASDNDVNKYLTWETHKSIEETHEVIAIWVDEYKNKETYNWCIELKEISTAIGSITVIGSYQKHQVCELGYCMSKEHWNQGIMSEAVKAVISFLFKEVGFHRIQAHYDTQNISSGKVLENAGMKLEASNIRHRRIRKDGNHADGNLMAIIYDDWVLNNN